MKSSNKRTYYRDPNLDVHAVNDEYYDQTEICLAELIKGDARACPIMTKFRTSGENEPMKDKNKNARIFSFDVKADFIFDKPYKDKQIKLSD